MKAETPTNTARISRSDAEWRAILTPEQYDVLRRHGTERPGSCALNHEKRAGAFHCVGCGQELFRSGEKFDDSNMIAKRPGTGLSPMRWDEVIGRTARRNFASDEPIEL